MRKGDLIKTLSWLVPLTCAALAITLVFMQYQRRENRIKEVAQARETAASLRESIEHWKTSEGRDRIPSVADSIEEERTFLDEVRQVAIAHNIKLIKWVNEPESPPATTGPLDSTNKPAPLPEAVKGVRTLSSTVEIRGSFGGVRGFMRDLLGSPRLLTVKSGVWSRGDDPGDTQFSFKLNRYVSQPEPVAAPTTATPQDGRDVAQR